MGASCSRWDCAVVVEDCTNKSLTKRPSFWYDCAGQQQGSKWGSSSSREDTTELVASQEPEVQLVCDKFAVHKPVRGGAGGRNAGSEWRRRYVLGRELGAGQTAIVFEAFAVGHGVEDAAANGNRLWYPDGGNHVQPHRKSMGRRVALKRFYNPGTLMFQQELQALNAVGVHPHILRLLESYEGGNDEDVLVLEHCDGGDVYELYAANNGCCMLEAFVLQLVRQLLLAIEHLVERGVEHRDVKPENLLLYGPPSDSLAIPQLKLADFGWAVLLSKDKTMPAVPAEGVGSLWYAPPELNPPVEGIPIAAASSPAGRSDMWSVGIITYLLLIGHSPFNPALRVADPLARENEVIRLAALGQINMSTRPWAGLTDEARAFICALIQPQPGQRLTPHEAWRHPFLARWQDGYGNGKVPHATVAMSSEAERNERWGRLDGFQRLAWLAFARAVSEPELMDVPTLHTFINQQLMTVKNGRSGNALYLDHLAMEIASAAAPQWFLPQAAFADIMFLAYHYLDCDADGLLSVSDLLLHMVGETQEVRACADCWVGKWRRGCEALPVHSVHALDFADFRRALCASCEMEPHGSHVHMNAIQPTDAAGNGARGKSDVMLEKRMQAIDEVCQRFLDEEFDDFGYGF